MMTQSHNRRPAFARRIVLAACLAFTVALFGATVRAYADCDCTCEQAQQAATRQTILDQAKITRQFIDQEFKDFQVWVSDDYYKQWVMPAMKMMAEQLVTNGENQMKAVGSMLDAKTQLETQLLLQQRTAQAHKDYQPSLEMCVMGTAQQHIASTERRVNLAAHVLNKHALDRQLGNDASEAADGPASDATSRLDQVVKQYCNPNDNHKSLTFICPTGGPQSRRNRDIDYARVMGDANSLDINLSDTAITNDEQDLFALQNYLYVNHPFSRITKPVMNTQEGQELWMAMRGVMAKHNVALNSFNNVMALKAAMPDDYTDNSKLMGVVFQRMGLSQDDAQKLMARKSDTGTSSTASNKPSYYQILQTLSQGLYQQPTFYVNLYDTPTNVDRKAVAMEAINLLLDRESYNSELREEMVLSQILEAQVVQAQERHENAVNDLQRNAAAATPSTTGTTGTTTP